jgi:hypothetical protein
MSSKDHVYKIYVSDEPRGEVLFEGELGELNEIEFTDGIMLKLSGDKGTFRIDLTEGELSKGLAKHSKKDTS